MTHPSPDAAAAGVRAASAGPRTRCLEPARLLAADVLPTLAGDVLDVGTGEGASLIHLPNSARVVLLEPQPRFASRLNS
jgi:hypothetical protein